MADFSASGFTLTIHNKLCSKRWLCYLATALRPDRWVIIVVNLRHRTRTTPRSFTLFHEVQGHPTIWVDRTNRTFSYVVSNVPPTFRWNTLFVLAQKKVSLLAKRPLTLRSWQEIPLNFLPASFQFLPIPASLQDILNSLGTLKSCLVGKPHWSI